MHKCSICGSGNVELYPVDDHLVCETCLTQGRLEEIPELATAGRREGELTSAGATVSSWWNRDIPDRIAR